MLTADGSKGRGGNPLTDSSAVNAALSLLEFADHPGDDFLGYHLATSPLAQHAGIAWNADADSRAEASRSLRRSWNELGAAEFLARLERTVQEHYSAFDQRRFAQLIALAQRIEASDPLRPAHFAERLSLERVPDVASAAIQVMTVHGAKGLQFDAVILIDCDGPMGKAERGVIAQRRDADPRAPADIVTHTLGNDEDLANPELHRAQVTAKSARLLEELCVLYVALTRAVHAIEIVIDYPKDNLKKSSFAGILLQSLGVEDPKPDSLIWFDPLEQPRSVPSVMHNPAQPVEREAPARIQLQARRAATSHVRPSQVAHTSDAARSTAELFSANEAARKRGRLWHAWLERIAWSEDGSPNSVQLAEWARACGRRSRPPKGRP
jgi:ATP-dependent exoDNAse (exonuclease V) beta subunit